MVKFLTFAGIFCFSLFTLAFEIDVWETIKIGRTVTYNVGPLFDSCHSAITLRFDKKIMFHGPFILPRDTDSQSVCDYSNYMSGPDFWTTDINFNLKKNQRCVFDTKLADIDIKLGKLALICDPSKPVGIQ